MGEVPAVLKGLRPDEVNLVASLSSDLVKALGRRMQAEGFNTMRGGELIRRTLVIALSAAIYADPRTDKQALTEQAAELVRRGRLDD